MSAAEKLEALDERGTPGPWFAQVNDLVGGTMVANADQPSSELNAKEGRYEICDLMLSNGHDAGVIAAVRNALPEIIAVVKAAEENAIEPAYAEYPQQADLFIALSALDEALPDLGVATDSESPPLR